MVSRMRDSGLVGFRLQNPMLEIFPSACDCILGVCAV